MIGRIAAVGVIVVATGLVAYAIVTGQWRYLSVLALLPLVWIVLGR